MKAGIPNLNHAEISRLAQELNALTRDCFVDRVVVPAQPLFPQGYLKNHWAIRLNDPAQKRSFWLELSVRGTKPFLRVVPGAKKAQASQSAFGLALEKKLIGAKLESIEAEKAERWLRIRFSGNLTLVLIMIPAACEVILLEDHLLLARSRTGLGNDPRAATLSLPKTSTSTQEFKVRPEWDSHSKIARAIDQALEAEAFHTRKAVIEQALRQQSKKIKDLERSRTQLLVEIAKAPPWKDLGDLYQARMTELPPRVEGKITLIGWDDQPVVIPIDEKLDPPRQLKALYQKSKRIEQKKKELDQATEDLKLLTDRVSQLLNQFQKLNDLDWNALREFESKLSIDSDQESQSQAISAHHKNWPGRRYESIDGQAFWVGRSSAENLDLTFKHAKGNDLWLHLRGRPSSHAVIPLPAGKSASLETLLDAAHAIIHHAGGKHWGKTEVDYTLKKHVKKIKGSTEASYSQNKTLIVTPEAARFERLLAAPS